MPLSVLLLAISLTTIFSIHGIGIPSVHCPLNRFTGLALPTDLASSYMSGKLLMKLDSINSL
jgi:hypothetical protein